MFETRQNKLQIERSLCEYYSDRTIFKDFYWVIDLELNAKEGREESNEDHD